MDPIRVFDTVEKIKNVWEKKIGILFILIAVVMLYLLAAKFIDSDFAILKFYNLGLIGLLIFVFIYWLITTHRFLIKDQDIVGIYICISCEEEFELTAKKIFSVVCDEFKRDKILRILHVRFLPLNKFKNTSEMETWLMEQKGNRNAIILLNIKHGKINSEEKININSLSYSGFFKNNTLSIEGKSLNIQHDLNLRLKDIDWTYFEKNSLNDKEKLRNNLKNLILYYGGLVYLNEMEFEKSRVLLKLLYNTESSIISGKIDSNNNKQINFEVKTENLQAGRLNYLLTHIYLKCIMERFNKNLPSESIALLKEVETIPTPPEIKLIINMNFAYVYFVVGNIAQSKIHTNKIHEINSNSFAYLINMGFYAIIENKPIELVKYYSAINEHGVLDTQPTEVIGFLSDNQNKYPESKLLFEIAIAVLTKLFIDDNDGNQKLTSIIIKIPALGEYKAIKKYCEKTFKQKLPKKLQRQRHKLKKVAA